MGTTGKSRGEGPSQATPATAPLFKDHHPIGVRQMGEGGKGNFSWQQKHCIPRRECLNEEEEDFI